MTITDVRTVAVAVTDQSAALDFYVSTLGFDKRMDAPIDDQTRWVEVAPPDATTSIALTPASTSIESDSDTGIRLVTADAAREREVLLSRGVDVDELLLWPDAPPMFSFRDPDGNILYVVQTVSP